jgi:hypothetical protein
MAPVGRTAGLYSRIRHHEKAWQRSAVPRLFLPHAGQWAAGLPVATQLLQYKYCNQLLQQAFAF